MDALENGPLLCYLEEDPIYKGDLLVRSIENPSLEKPILFGCLLTGATVTLGSPWIHYVSLSRSRRFYDKAPLQWFIDKRYRKPTEAEQLEVLSWML